MYTRVPEEMKLTVLSAVRTSTQLAVPSDLTDLEAKFQYNWVTMIPFVEMLFVELSPIDEGRPTFLHDEGRQVALNMAVVGLEVEMGRKRNRQLAIQQGLLDYLVCAPWGMPRKWSDRLGRVIAGFCQEVKCLPVPRLSAIVKTMSSRQCGVKFRI